MVSQNPQAQLPASDTWQKESCILQQQQATEPTREINLREALEWLLGSPETHEVLLSDEEKERRKERRMDLLIWLMNLELRLSPYTEPA